MKFPHRGIDIRTIVLYNLKSSDTELYGLDAKTDGHAQVDRSAFKLSIVGSGKF